MDVRWLNFYFDGLRLGKRVMVQRTRKVWLGIILFLVSLYPVFAQTAISVADTSGWNAWTVNGSYIIDPIADQQTGQGTDDIVGTALIPALQQKAGIINTSNYVLFRARMANFGGTVNKFGSNGGNFGMGLDLDLNGSIDLMMVFSQKSNGATSIKFGLPGSNTNTSPSTTSWTFPTQTVITPVAYSGLNPTLASYYIQDATIIDGNNINSGTKTPDDAWLTFGLTFEQMNYGINGFAPGFGNYTFGYDSTISYVAFTSTQDNALNQDLAGTSGNLSSSASWTSLGAASDPVDAYGRRPIVPEPSTYGALMLALGLGVVLWRKIRRQK